MSCAKHQACPVRHLAAGQQHVWSCGEHATKAVTPASMAQPKARLLRPRASAEPTRAEGQVAIGVQEDLLARASGRAAEDTWHTCNPAPSFVHSC